MNYIIEVNDGIEIVEMLLEDWKSKEIVMFEEVNSQEIRNLQELNMTKDRVFMVYGLDYKIKEQNMLLKTLEEENENDFLLFVENKNNLIPTIINRCQFLNRTKPKQIEMNEEVKTLTEKVVNHIHEASLHNLFVLLEKVKQINCQEQHLRFIELLTLEYGVDPMKNRNALAIVGKAHTQIKKAPQMKDSIFTVMLLDLKEL